MKSAAKSKANWAEMKRLVALGKDHELHCGSPKLPAEQPGGSAMQPPFMEPESRNADVFGEAATVVPLPERGHDLSDDVEAVLRGLDMERGGR